MRKNFGTKSWFYPLPVLVIGTYDENGNPDAMNAAWGGLDVYKRQSQEYADESLRDVELVSDTVENWDSYDTVFIGYPIWWGIAA